MTATGRAANSGTSLTVHLASLRARGGSVLAVGP